MNAIDFSDPRFDLEPTEIIRINFNPNTPVNTINRDLNKYGNKFIIGHINARSLNKNIVELREIISRTNFDAFAISESWLTKNTPIDRYQINNFNIFRKDRSNKRGGGVAIYIRDHYKAKIIQTPCNKEIPEMIWVEVAAGNNKLAIGCLYKAPKIPCSVFVNSYDCLIQIYAKYDHTVLLGDFNVNMLDLNSNNSKILLDSIIEPFSLTQFIDKPTRITDKSKTLIDLIFANKPENVLFSSCCDAPGVSDHCITYVAYSLKKEKFKPYKVTKRDFKNVNWAEFHAAVENAPWENILVVNDINDMVTILENYINEILDKYAPFKTFVVKKPNFTPWINKDIRKIMNQRDSVKYDFNVTGNLETHELYKELRNKVTTLRRQAQTKMFNETINKSVKNSKQFYDAAKKLRVMTSKNETTNVNFSPDKLNNAFLASNNAKIDSDLINDQIRQMYTKNPPCIHSFHFEPVSAMDVLKIVKSLNSNSTGADNINAFILKLFIDRISSPLAHIINTSFEQKIFPDKWKLAIIKPIPKIPFPLTETDFRPISILCTLSKIIEKLALKQICGYLNLHNLFDPNQSAYRRHHGCITALLKITDDIFDGIDDSEITLLILLDFSKAFDTVNHKLLLEKLNILGFTQDAKDWIKSYLSDRSQRVKCNNDVSSWEKIVNGVPQGSILGPLLFMILVSDMRQYITSFSSHQYADDLQMHKNTKIETVNETIKEANLDLTAISKYCKNSALTINEKKSYAIFIGSRPAIRKLDNLALDNIIINNKIIKRVSHVRNLGLTMDEVLSWRRHVNLMIGRAIGKIKNLCRFKKFLNEKSKQLLCESLVLSQFHFGDIVYMNIDLIAQKKIQKIQNMCVKFIFNIKRRDHCDYEALRLQLGWVAMTEKRVSNGLVLLYKILQGKAPDYLKDMFTLISEINERNLRTYAGNIYLPNENQSAIHLKGFRNYISKVWNSLPEDIKTAASLNIFKNKLKKAILSKDINLPQP